MSYLSDIRLQGPNGLQENLSWPAEVVLGFNIYAYAGGDPLNATDPSGMNWVNDGGTYGAGYNNNMGGGACGCEGNPEHETMQNYMNQQVAYDSSSSGLLPQPVLVENLPPPPGMAPALNPNQLAFLAPAAGVAADVGLGILAAPAAGLGALLYPNSTAANDTCAGGGCSPEQFVVRAGAGAANSFATGTALTINGYGFSVQTAPGLSIDELARGGSFPNAQISVSTVGILQQIPGVTVNFPTPGAGLYHGTVNVPNPAPPGLFGTVAGAFTQQPNPYRVQRP